MYQPAVATIAAPEPISPYFRREELLDVIQNRSVFTKERWSKRQMALRSPNGRFCSWCIDLRTTFLHPKGVATLAYMFWEEFETSLPFQLGGLEMGAVPLITAIQLEGHRRGHSINGFVVRKERKNYGLTKDLEGVLTEEPIFVVDDLINSGETLDKVRAVLKTHERMISQAFVIIDYQTKRGSAWRESHSIPVHALFTLTDLGLKRPPAKLSEVSKQFTTAWRFGTTWPTYFDVVPKSTPVVTGSHVIFGSCDGNLNALDLSTGEKRWSFATHDTGRKKIFSSPAMYQSKVLFGSYDGDLYCLDHETGLELWRFAEADWIGSSPVVMPEFNLVAVGLEYALPGMGGSVVFLDLDTGEKVFEYGFKDYVHCTPAYEPQAGLLAIGSNGGTVVLIDVATRKLRWKFKCAGAVKQAPAFDTANDNLIFGSFDKSIYCIDLATGLEKARIATHGVLYSTPLIHEQVVVVSSTDKRIYVIEATEFTVNKVFDTPGRNYASPTLIDGEIWVGSTSGKVHAINPRNWTMRTAMQLPERITNPPVYCAESDLYYVLTYDTALWAMKRVGQ